MPDNKPTTTVHPSNIAANAKSKRERLSPAPLDPLSGRSDPSQMKSHQAALRQAVVDSFNAKKARTFLQKQVHHISTNRELADGIKFLFDEHGRPRIVRVDDPGGTVGQHLEEPALGDRVGLHVAVEIEMVAGQIGEHAGREPRAIDAPEGERV